jgi:hypothetical protein
LGLTQVVVPAGHTVFVLTLHDPWLQGSPALVTGWQVPQMDVADRAQNVVAHCASSPQGPP